jgi:LCP family protein required for cell wall assembly
VAGGAVTGAAADPAGAAAEPASVVADGAERPDGAPPAAEEPAPSEEGDRSAAAAGSGPEQAPLVSSAAIESGSAPAGLPAAPPLREGPPLRGDRKSVQAARRQERKKAGRKWPKRVLIGVSVLVILAVLVGVGGYAYVRYRYSQIKKVHARHLVPVADPGKPFNILVVGSDSRAFVTNPVQQNAFGSATAEGGQRSDVTMVARVIPATKQVWVLSIPRDLWVDIPGDVAGVSGMNRINVAFNGGPDLLIQTIEQDLSIPISYYVAVNFDGFQNMVDALGGITMNFPDPVKDSYSGLNVATTGCQVVGGYTALELVRARHLYYEQDGVWQPDVNSDISRIQRQDEFFRAVLTKLNASITNPFAVNGFIGAAVKNVTIDDTLSVGELFRLAEQFHGMPSANLHTETLPTYGYVTDGGAQVLGEAEPYAARTIYSFNLEGMPKPKPAATPTTTTVPTEAPGAVHVQVLNGFGGFNAATNAASQLEAAGFDVSSVGDASSFTYTTTTIEYGPEGETAAATVAASVDGATTMTSDPALGADQVTLIVGSSFTGAHAPGTAAASPSNSGAAPASTTTTTPAGNVYTNDQLEPWNPVPC